ncbi:MAG: patatin-like phospholipase family protein [Gammaproteobacteria bacterium]|nr:patatin-like phospholipase family protein [Gammaproteobacteria bacterium]NND47221.1 BamA/TamA family outer membrane protein [Woeseiaceae bacterium]NNL44785.1 BamA/TamA family outer membrane protein [Woeseiaceae bacterium]
MTNTTHFTWRLAAVLTLLVTAASDANAQIVDAQAQEEHQRPRIGLVLGGGGARGAAHIGVLKELERLRVPVDFIAGTSMGAIVGGLYASGMTAHELEELAGSLDWAAALTDKPSREDLSFRRKQDDTQFPIDFELGVRGTDLVLPKGVIQGQKLDLLLRELTMRVSHIRDFDDLPIPFRAVASDIERGEARVMGSGDLARAMRASMSVPGVFAPVRIHGRLLVDGGLMGNLPIEVMQQMDVDVIIAVDVEFPLYGREELGSALAISEQMLTILIRKETLRQVDRLEDHDILIRPELGKYGSSDFGNIVGTIEPGVAAARAQSDRLQSVAIDEARYAAYQALRAAPLKTESRLEFVRVVHEGRLSPAVLRSRLSVQAGDPIDPQKLAANADRLYGLQLYEQVGYNLVQEDGRTGVEYRATTKSWGPNFMQFGMSLEDDFEGSTGFNIKARMTRAGLNRLGAEWRTDLQLGTDPELFSEFYQPLSFDSRWFIAPRINMAQSNLNVFSSNETIARLRVSEAETGLDFGREIGTFGEFRVGAFRGLGEARVKVGDPALPNIEFDTGGAFAALRFDTLDNAQFPRSGVRADLRWTLSRPGLGADNKFDTVSGEVASSWSRGKDTLQLGLAYATTLDSNSALQDYFPLGGFLRLSGLERGEISGPHAALARLVYYRRVGETTGAIFDTPVYFGVSAEAGNVWQTRSDIGFDSTVVNGSLFAGIDTVFGPVYLAAGFAERGQSNVYLFIGEPPR